jgi:FkbM family methyltransferase
MLLDTVRRLARPLRRRLKPVEASAPSPDLGAPVTTSFRGYSFVTLTNDFTTTSLLYGHYEPHLFDRLLEDARKVKNAIDIGANLGLLAVPLADTISGHLYCFELSAANAKLLYANLRRNRLENVDVFPIALGAKLGSFALARNAFTSLNSVDQVAPDDTLLAPGTEITPVLPLDAMFGPAGVEIDLIKIDVDGADYDVLSGARETIARWRPLLYTEYCPFLMERVSGVSGKQYLKILLDLGYRVEVLGPFVETGPLASTDLDEIDAALNARLASVYDSGQRHIDLRWAHPDRA